MKKALMPLATSRCSYVGLIERYVTTLFAKLSLRARGSPDASAAMLAGTSGPLHEPIHNSNSSWEPSVISRVYWPMA